MNIETGIWIAIGAIVVVMAVVSVHTSNAFKEACEATGGKAVFDGRQWQCMKVSGG